MEGRETTSYDPVADVIQATRLLVGETPAGGARRSTSVGHDRFRRVGADA